jgi:hypothetical protein
MQLVSARVTMPAGKRYDARRWTAYSAARSPATAAWWEAPWGDDQVTTA